MAISSTAGEIPGWKACGLTRTTGVAKEVGTTERPSKHEKNFAINCDLEDIN